MNDKELAGLDHYLTVEQVATLLGVSSKTVIRQFENLDGTIDLGSPETMHKRRKRILRIPKATYQKYVAGRLTKPKRWLSAQ